MLLSAHDVDVACMRLSDRGTLTNSVVGQYIYGRGSCFSKAYSLAGRRVSISWDALDYLATVWLGPDVHYVKDTDQLNKLIDEILAAK